MNLYEQSSAMEPMLPRENAELKEIAFALAKATARLSASVHPKTAIGIATLVKSMNSYYSNLIEGHHTHPKDIERALRDDFSKDPALRALQMESAAHIQVQNELENRLLETPKINLCAAETLCWIHKLFYDKLPELLRILEGHAGNQEKIVPGELRKTEVAVGRHIGPAASVVPILLSRFSAVYSDLNFDPATRIIAAACSHHRFAWIHPFLDGNGRVGRLFSHGFLIQAGLHGHGLWSISRGLARHKHDYLSSLAGADAPRWNDLDGRGNLSERGLIEFCRFFLQTAIDQAQFMEGLLQLDTILERISFFSERWARQQKKEIAAGRLLPQAFLQGEITRGEAGEILNRPERSSRRIISALLAAGLITSEGPGKPIRLGFPLQAVAYYFPKLYPEGVEMDFTRED